MKQYKNIKWASEEGNDHWVAEIFNYKTNGFFVDAGATGGTNNSAIVLEKTLNWDGISVNPNTSHYNLVKNKQKRMNVEKAALWSSNGIIDFYDIPKGTFSKSVYSYNKMKQDLSYASAVVGHEGNYAKDEVIEHGKIIKIESITLESLLKKYNAPEVVDYIGLDVEGSEYNVLKVFPFDKYKVLAMSIENSDNFQDYLESVGFTRVVNPFCPKAHEHHYINNKILGDYPFEKY